MATGGFLSGRRLGNRNTRESIFDAMQRKEVYGTTGSRMVIRFFGGWDLRDRAEGSDAPEFMVCLSNYFCQYPFYLIFFTRFWQTSRNA